MGDESRRRGTGLRRSTTVPTTRTVESVSEPQDARQMRIVYVPGTRESPGNVNGPCPASAAGTATIKRANSLVMIFTALSNGSRLSCGRNGRGRKAVEPQIKRLASEGTQFFPHERPAASSAC